MYGAGNGVSIKRDRHGRHCVRGLEALFRTLKRSYFNLCTLMTFFYMKKLCKVRLITLVVTTFYCRFI